jgi:hypothetical protein
MTDPGQPADFIHVTRWTGLPAAVQAQTVHCLLDTLGAAVAGRLTELLAGLESPPWLVGC